MLTWQQGAQKKIYTDFQTPRTVPFYSQEGELFSIVDGQDTIEVWDVERNEKNPDFRDAFRGVLMRSWFREFPQLAFADIHTNTTPDQKVKLGNIHTFSTLREPDCFSDPVLFLPDGETLAIRGASDRYCP